MVAKLAYNSKSIIATEVPFSHSWSHILQAIATKNVSITESNLLQEKLFSVIYNPYCVITSVSVNTVLKLVFPSIELCCLFIYMYMYV